MQKSVRSRARGERLGSMPFLDRNDPYSPVHRVGRNTKEKGILR